MSTQIVDLPEVLKPISWLIGKWESVDGRGQFPQLSNFKYHERIEFKPCGVQPLLIYTMLAHEPGDPSTSIHVESGFLRATSDGKGFSLCLAHDTGFTTVEEGQVTPGEMKLVVRSEKISISKSYIETHVLQTERSYEREGNILKKRFGMATAKMPELKHHLDGTFKLVDKFN